MHSNYKNTETKRFLSYTALLHFMYLITQLVEGDETDTIYYMYIIRAVTATLYAFH